MKKVYLLIILLIVLIANSRLLAQCSVVITTSTNTTEINCTNPTITLTAQATGDGDVSYKWNTEQTSASINVTDAGEYRVEIMDSENCQSSSTITITKNVTKPVVTIQAFPKIICNGEKATLVALGAVNYEWTPLPVTTSEAIVEVQPAKTTKFEVTGTGANGCSSASSVDVLVNQLPAASISGNNSVCQNDPNALVTFTGANGFAPYTFAYVVNEGPLQTVTSYNQNPSSTEEANTVSIHASTTTVGNFNYKLKSVKDRNGCMKSVDRNAIIAVLPAASLTTSKTASVCDGATFKYSAQSSVANTTFSWKRIQASSQTVTHSSAEIDEILYNADSLPIVVSYVFSLSTRSGCVKTDTVKVTVNPTPKINPIRIQYFATGYLLLVVLFLQARLPMQLLGGKTATPRLVCLLVETETSFPSMLKIQQVLL